MKDFIPGTIRESADLPGVCPICRKRIEKGKPFQFGDWVDITPGERPDFRGHIECIKNSPHNTESQYQNKFVTTPVDLDNDNTLKIIREALAAALDVLDRYL